MWEKCAWFHCRSSCEDFVDLESGSCNLATHVRVSSASLLHVPYTDHTLPLTCPFLGFLQTWSYNHTSGDSAAGLARWQPLNARYLELKCSSIHLRCPQKGVMVSAWPWKRQDREGSRCVAKSTAVSMHGNCKTESQNPRNQRRSGWNGFASSTNIKSLSRMRPL